MGSRRRILVNGTAFEIDVINLSRDSATFALDGRTYEVQFESHVPKESPQNVTTAKSPLALDSESLKAAKVSKAVSHQKEASNNNILIRAPLCGVVLEVCVGLNAKVDAGDILLRIEAMKMENNIFSPAGGTIAQIYVEAGNEVTDGQLLLEIAA